MIAHFFSLNLLDFQITLLNVARSQEYLTSCGLSLAHFFPYLHVLRDIVELTQRLWIFRHETMMITRLTSVSERKYIFAHASMKRFAFVRLRRPCPRGRRKRRCFASLMALRGRLGKICMVDTVIHVLGHTKYHHSYRQKTEYQARLN